MMQDLIDRQAAIDAIRASTSKYTGFMEMEMYTDDDAVEAIEALPSAQPTQNTRVNSNNALDTISRQAALEALEKSKEIYFDRQVIIGAMKDIVRNLPSAQPEIIQCKDCKHNPKESWFGCPMSHLSEEQRPGTAWCWRAERREDDHETN